MDPYVENEKLMIDATPSNAGLHSLVLAKHSDNSLTYIYTKEWTIDIHFAVL